MIIAKSALPIALALTAQASFMPRISVPLGQVENKPDELEVAAAVSLHHEEAPMIAVRFHVYAESDFPKYYGQRIWNGMPSLDDVRKTLALFSEGSGVTLEISDEVWATFVKKVELARTVYAAEKAAWAERRAKLESATKSTTDANSQ